MQRAWVLSYTMKISLFWWESHSARIRVSYNRKSWRGSLYRNLRSALRAAECSMRLYRPIQRILSMGNSVIILRNFTPEVHANTSCLYPSKCLSLHLWKKIVSDVQTRHLGEFLKFISREWYKWENLYLRTMSTFLDKFHLKRRTQVWNLQKEFTRSSVISPSYFRVV